MNKNKTNIRAATQKDTEALMSLCKAIGLFQPNELEELSAMLSSYFAGNLQGEHKWLVDDENGQLVSVAYYAEESFAYRVFNLLLIGVHPDYQREGRGSQLLRYVEEELTAKDIRILIVETSGLKSFAGTRAFYLKNEYDEEARIREFYKPGEDKIVFRKALNI